MNNAVNVSLDQIIYLNIFVFIVPPKNVVFLLVKKKNYHFKKIYFSFTQFSIAVYISCLYSIHFSYIVFLFAFFFLSFSFLFFLLFHSFDFACKIKIHKIKIKIYTKYSHRSYFPGSTLKMRNLTSFFF